eukprot:scaffold261927_cov24-Tisochrysis_lutea.AAC.1
MHIECCREGHTLEPLSGGRIVESTHLRHVCAVVKVGQRHVEAACRQQVAACLRAPTSKPKDVVDDQQASRAGRWRRDKVDAPASRVDNHLSSALVLCWRSR